MTGRHFWIWNILQNRLFIKIPKISFLTVSYFCSFFPDSWFDKKSKQAEDEVESLAECVGIQAQLSSTQIPPRLYKTVKAVFKIIDDAILVWRSDHYITDSDVRRTGMYSESKA